MLSAGRALALLPAAPGGPAAVPCRGSRPRTAPARARRVPGRRGARPQGLSRPRAAAPAGGHRGSARPAPTVPPLPGNTRQGSHQPAPPRRWGSAPLNAAARRGGGPRRRPEPRAGAAPPTGVNDARTRPIRSERRHSRGPAANGRGRRVAPGRAGSDSTWGGAVTAP